jgi:hypothetical protein
MGPPSPAATSRPRVVVADRDPVFLEVLRLLLRDEGYEALVPPELKDPYPFIKAARPAAVVLDAPMARRRSCWSCWARCVWTRPPPPRPSWSAPRSWTRWKGSGGGRRSGAGRRRGPTCWPNRSTWSGCWPSWRRPCGCPRPVGPSGSWRRAAAARVLITSPASGRYGCAATGPGREGTDGPALGRARPLPTDEPVKLDRRGAPCSPAVARLRRGAGGGGGATVWWAAAAPPKGTPTRSRSA